MVDTKPKGRPMAEIHALVKADSERFDKFTIAWNGLLPEEQEELVALAEKMAEEGKEN